MTNIEFSLITFLGSLLAGGLGAMTGLGGGIVITPLLVFLMGVDIRFAIGASLVAVIATSIGSTAINISSGFTNIRSGIFLATATTCGAIIGAFLINDVPTSALFILFGLVLLIALLHTPRKEKEVISSKLATFLELDGTIDDNGVIVHYGVRRVALGWFIMLIAGFFSGLLGIGSGALNVLAMDSIMKYPFKMATATSNFIMGITGAASIGIYFYSDIIEPTLIMPVILGVFLGAIVGAKIHAKIEAKNLRRLFSILIFLMALLMIYRGIRS